MWGGMAGVAVFYFSFRFSLGAVLGEIQDECRCTWVKSIF